MIGETALFSPPFSPPSGRLFWKFMSTYNRRFAQIARRRRREGRLGMTNRGRRCLLSGYTFNRGNMLRIFPMLFDWAKLEITEGWRSWRDSVETSKGADKATTPPEASELADVR